MSAFGGKADIGRTDLLKTGDLQTLKAAAAAA
jgi:hypothetical protein